MGIKSLFLELSVKFHPRQTDDLYNREVVILKLSMFETIEVFNALLLPKALRYFANQNCVKIVVRPRYGTTDVHHRNPANFSRPIEKIA